MRARKPSSLGSASGNSSSYSTLNSPTREVVREGDIVFYQDSPYHVDAITKTQVSIRGFDEQTGKSVGVQWVQTKNVSMFMSVTDIAEVLQSHVEVKDRKYHLRTYKQCFIASEAVTFMPMNNISASREEAIWIGNQLFLAGYLQHVTGGHVFKDGYFFFRFNPQRVTLDRNIRSPQQLADMVDFLRSAVDVRDRKYRLTTYKQCFVASEVVDMLVTRKLATSRRDAINVGNQLLVAGHIEHVKKEHTFKDSFLFFKFTQRNRSNTRVRIKSGSHKGRTGYTQRQEENGKWHIQMTQMKEMKKM